jgi:hypothetical protein
MTGRAIITATNIKGYDYQPSLMDKAVKLQKSLHADRARPLPTSLMNESESCSPISPATWLVCARATGKAHTALAVFPPKDMVFQQRWSGMYLGEPSTSPFARLYGHV